MVLSDLADAAALAARISAALADKPGELVEDVDMVRNVAALSYLSERVYDVKGLAPGHREEVPGGGTALLLHVQRAGATSAQQYTIWELPGLEVVAVAFRGTETDDLRDIFINLAFRPASLAAVLPPPSRCAATETLRQLASPILVHQGVLAAVAQQAPAIASVLRARYGGERPAAGAFRPGQLVLTGHSLGGAYATALLLHIMSTPSLHDLLHFEQGAVACTFGAPFILTGEPAQAYAHMIALQQCLGGRGAFLHIVNGPDPVPRLLGPNLDEVKDALADLLPGVATARSIADRYLPLGCYCLLHDGDLRTICSDPHGVGGLQSAQQAVEWLRMSHAMAPLLAGSVADGLQRRSVSTAVAPLSPARILGFHSASKYRSELCSMLQRLERAAQKDDCIIC